MNRLSSSTPSKLPSAYFLWVEISEVTRLLMECLLGVIWYQSLVHTFMPALWKVVPYFKALFFFFLITYLSRFFMRFLQQRKIDNSKIRMYFSIFLLISAILSFQWMIFPGQHLTVFQIPEKFFIALTEEDASIGVLIHLCFLVLVVWRGASSRMDAIDLIYTQRSFQFCLFLLIVYGLIYSSTTGNYATVPALLFLWVSLLALSTARIASMSLSRGGRLPAKLTPWLAAIAIAALIMTSLSVLGGNFLSQYVSWIFMVLLALLSIVLILVSAIIALPFLAIIYFILPFLNKFFNVPIESLPKAEIANITDQFLDSEQLLIQNISNGLGQIYPIIIGGAVILLLLIFLVRLSRRSEWLSQILFEDGESISPKPTNLSINADQHPKKRSFLTPANALAAARIRRVYAQLMNLCTRLEHPRPPAKTPIEFLPALEDLFPSCKNECGIITSAYIQIRYGEIPEKEEEIRAVETAWNEIQISSRSMLIEQKRRQAAEKHQKKSR